MSYKARDQEAADDYESNQNLRCRADGCPNLWSVSTGGRGMCSAHAWSPARLWPEITREQQDAVLARSRPSSEVPTAIPDLTDADKRAILDKLRKALSPEKQIDRVGWAWRILERHESGEWPRPTQAALAMANQAILRRTLR